MTPFFFLMLYWAVECAAVPLNPILSTEHEGIETNNSRPSLRRVAHCGYPDFQIKTDHEQSGGEIANEYSFPWHVALLNRENVFICSGTILSRYWIITAGRCIDLNDPIYRVLGGIRRLDPEGRFHQAKFNKTVPSYNLKPLPGQNNKENDFGLIHMQDGMHFNYWLKAACFGVVPAPIGTIHIIPGWRGVATGEVVENQGVTQAYLTMKDACGVTLVNKTCAGGIGSVGKPQYRIPCKFIGGGLVSQNSGSGLWFLHGVLADDLSCKTEVHSALFSKVANYRAWVELNIDTKIPWIEITVTTEESVTVNIGDNIEVSCTVTFGDPRFSNININKCSWQDQSSSQPVPGYEGSYYYDCLDLSLKITAFNVSDAGVKCCEIEVGELHIFRKVSSCVNIMIHTTTTQSTTTSTTTSTTSTTTTTTTTTTTPTTTTATTTQSTTTSTTTSTTSTTTTTTTTTTTPTTTTDLPIGDPNTQQKRSEMSRAKTYAIGFGFAASFLVLIIGIIVVNNATNKILKKEVPSEDNLVDKKNAFSPAEMSEHHGSTVAYNNKPTTVLSWQTGSTQTVE